jgi:hypothetical protein
VDPGDIYRIPAFYADVSTGALLSKYILILAKHPSGDLVARLLTSRAHGRPQAPPCFQGYPYPGFFLGVPGTPLAEPTWVDLRAFYDVDRAALALRIDRGATLSMSLPRAQLLDVMACVAGADDTTQAQERALRDTLSALRAR